MELHYTVHLYGRLATCVLGLYTLSCSFLLQTVNITKPCMYIYQLTCVQWIASGYLEIPYRYTTYA